MEVDPLAIVVVVIGALKVGVGLQQPSIKFFIPNEFACPNGRWNVVLIHEMYELGIDPVFWKNQLSVQ